MVLSVWMNRYPLWKLTSTAFSTTVTPKFATTVTYLCPLSELNSLLAGIYAWARGKSEVCGTEWCPQNPWASALCLPSDGRGSRRKGLRGERLREKGSQREGSQTRGSQRAGDSERRDSEGRSSEGGPRLGQKGLWLTVAPQFLAHLYGHPVQMSTGSCQHCLLTGQHLLL